MKSHIKEEEKILLSIGMIVKNEEKHLDKCLKALKPLMEQVKSELIIVDTGSTDTTVEIAKRYTDKLYTFEWTGDFSEARNYGLEKAKGLWFMFVDADEYLDEDISEMVDFFKYPEIYNKYNSASYMLRNYLGKDAKYFADFLGSRMVKRTDDVRFKGKIHESLPMYVPHGYFGTIFHHYGYSYKENEQKEIKSERNLKPLLDEYEKNPKNMRTICHIFDVCAKEDREKYLNEWLDLAQKDRNQIYSNHAFLEGISFYAFKEEYEKAIDISVKFFEYETSHNAVSAIQIYAMLGYIYFNQKLYQEAYDAYMKYFELYEKYKNGKLDVIDLRCRPVKAIQPSERQEYLMNTARCLIFLSRDIEALKIMAEIDISKMNILNLKAYLSIVRELVDSTKDYSNLLNVYENFLTLFKDDKDKMDLVMYLLEECYYKAEDKISFANVFAYSEIQGDFIEIMKLLNSQKKSNFSSKLSSFLNSISYFGDGYSLVIYLAIKNGISLSLAISKMSYDRLRSYFPLLATNHEDYVNIIIEYCKPEDFVGSIKDLLWMVSALETAVLKVGDDEKIEQKSILYDMFINALSDYVFNIYNPELLNDEDIECLPPLHRFGYFISKANNYLANEDKIGYIKNLKEALRLCEPMKDLVAFKLQEFEKNLK